MADYFYGGSITLVLCDTRPLIQANRWSVDMKVHAHVLVENITFTLLLGIPCMHCHTHGLIAPVFIIVQGLNQVHANTLRRKHMRVRSISLANIVHGK